MRDYYARNADRMRELKREEAARRSPAQRKRVAEKAAEWAAQNPEKRQTARDKWRAANPEADKAAKRKWLEANREQHRATTEAWRRANLGRFNETGKAWKKANPGAMKKYRLRKYGLTVEQYEAMLKEQDNRCAICGTDTPAKHGSWCVDHCHDTNEPRGLLCVKCNAGLGHFDDSPAHLLAAERYLQRFATSKARKLRAV